MFAHQFPFIYHGIWKSLNTIIWGPNLNNLSSWSSCPVDCLQSYKLLLLLLLSPLVNVIATKCPPPPTHPSSSRVNIITTKCSLPIHPVVANIRMRKVVEVLHSVSVLIDYPQTPTCYFLSFNHNKILKFGNVQCSPYSLCNT